MGAWGLTVLAIPRTIRVKAGIVLPGGQGVLGLLHVIVMGRRLQYPAACTSLLHVAMTITLLLLLLLLGKVQVLAEAGLRSLHQDAAQVWEEPVLAGIAVLAQRELAYLLHVAVDLGPHNGLLLQGLEGEGWKERVCGRMCGRVCGRVGRRGCVGECGEGVWEGWKKRVCGRMWGGCVGGLEEEGVWEGVGRVCGRVCGRVWGGCVGGCGEGVWEGWKKRVCGRVWGGCVGGLEEEGVWEGVWEGEGVNATSLVMLSSALHMAHTPHVHGTLFTTLEPAVCLSSNATAYDPSSLVGVARVQLKGKCLFFQESICKRYTVNKYLYPHNLKAQRTRGRYSYSLPARSVP